MTSWPFHSRAGTLRPTSKRCLARAKGRDCALRPARSCRNAYHQSGSPTKTGLPGPTAAMETLRRGAMKLPASWLAIGALTLSGGLAHAEGDAAAGKTVFANHCASCHTIEVGKNGFGPSLAAVFGRKAGTLPGYKYSPAMANSGLTWDEKTLDVFLT